MAPRPDPRDPRFRSFRIAAYALFIAVSSAFALLVVVSVVRSVWKMSPGPLPPAETTLTVKECLDQADTLWRSLDGKRQELSAQPQVRGSELTWYAFREDWLHRLRLAESQCALDSHSRAPVKAVYGRLGDLLDAYTTSAVQFTGQVGGMVDVFRNTLAQARRDPSAGHF
jgi:hypothetical protein